MWLRHAVLSDKMVLTIKLYGDWINQELETLGKENYVHKAYEATLKPAYGDTINPEDIVIEGGKLK